MKLSVVACLAAAAFTALPRVTAAQDAAAPAAAAQEPAKDADALLKQINEVRPPKFDMTKREDQAYIQKYMAERQAAMQKRVELAKQFAEKYPDRPESADLLMFVAQMSDDDKDSLKIYRQIASKYPDSQAAKQAAGHIRRADAVGKPFDLSFTDAVSGKKVDMKDLKGKVVVVDFWATWCGPCVHEMPANKELYTKYHDKGVEFIGVSLDQPEAEGGLKALKEFVEKNEIKWPQYYQGNGWNSDFSKSWGINSIPTMFVIDADGTLYSAEARGQLETIIPKLLAKRNPA